MLIDYARVSKADGSQSLDLQRDALRADGVDAGHVYHDVASGAGARAMTDAPTRVAAQRWHHGVPGAAMAVMAAAATLLPGLAVAQDVYLRAGLDLSRPADTHFTDADCASLVPATLYGCGVGGDGAPLRSVGDVGTVAGVELGLGYTVAPAVRLEALLTSRPRFTFDGYANFLAPDREQSVSVDLSSLSGISAKERKRDTRRKILAGACVLDRADKDPDAARHLRKILDAFLTKPQDRALFDLPPRPKDA